MNTQLTAQDTWDALTCEVDEDGNRRWFDEDGNLHREAGPAFISPLGAEIWFNHGKYHREDGPAVIWAWGRIEYWIDNQSLTEEQFNVWKQLNG